MGVFKSSDAGQVWNPVNGGLTSVAVSSLWTDPAAPGSLYALTADGVFRTTDGARNWNPAVRELTQAIFSLASGSGSVLYAGGQGAVWRSADGGKTWKSFSLHQSQEPAGSLPGPKGKTETAPSPH
jgi:photosystem II stability/assembly factor-like uncharacterized protein